MNSRSIEIPIRRVLLRYFHSVSTVRIERLRSDYFAVLDRIRSWILPLRRAKESRKWGLGCFVEIVGKLQRRKHKE